MTKDEIIKLLHKTKAAYSSNFNKMSYEEGQQMVETWYDNLKDYEFKAVDEKLSAHIKTSKYAPKICDLIVQTNQKGFSNYAQDDTITDEEIANIKHLVEKYNIVLETEE